jgi:hypothetical protein
MHPGRAVKRAVTPKVVKRASRALYPIDNAVYSMERSANSHPIGRQAQGFGSCLPAWELPSPSSKCRNRCQLQEPIDTCTARLGLLIERNFMFMPR